jgi:hypothetical protein
MPQQQIPGTAARYWLISFNKNGQESKEDGEGLLTERILAETRRERPTHVFLFSHGWKGDLVAAQEQYDRWIAAMLNLRDDAARFGKDFKPLFIGLHWPSLPFGQETFEAQSFGTDSVAPEEALKAYIDFFDEGDPAVRRSLEGIFAAHRADAGAVRMPEDVAARYQELAAALQFETSEDPAAAPDEEGVAFNPRGAMEATDEAALSFGETNIESGLLAPLRQLSFWIMKKRARRVGEGGMHHFVASLQQALLETRFHLMGHSFGCIVVSGILGGAGGTRSLPRPVDSLALVQGAVSLWAYADKIMRLPKTGYFNKVVRRPSVRGPIVVTHSWRDFAVGVAYPLAVGLVGQIAFDVKILPPFGGIGSFGIQGATGTESLTMGPANTQYGFNPGGIYNLKSDEFIHGHCDISRPATAHLLWQAALV